MDMTSCEAAARAAVAGRNSHIKIFLCSKHKTAPSEERLHKHSGWSLFYNIFGTMRVAVMPGREVRLIDVQPGQFVFLSSLVPHRLRIGPEECYMLHLTVSPCGAENTALALDDLRAVSADAYRMLLKPSQLILASDINSMLMNTLTEILLNFESARRETGLMPVPGLLMQIMFMEIAWLSRQSMGPMSNQYVNKAMTYLKGHCTETVRVSEVAASIGVHPAYLQRVFREHTSMSLMEYLTRHRIERAARLLCTTTFSLLDIALDCGFNNRQHFARCFKQVHGMTPSAFRREKQLEMLDTEINYEEILTPADMRTLL